MRLRLILNYLIPIRIFVKGPDRILRRRLLSLIPFGRWGPPEAAAQVRASLIAHRWVSPAFLTGFLLLRSYREYRLRCAPSRSSRMSRIDCVWGNCGQGIRLICAP